MKKGNNQEIPFYRICPCCQRDILEHEEAVEYIGKHAELHKMKIEFNRESLTKELFKEHLQEELKTRSKNVIDLQMKIGHPMHDITKMGIILLESWKNINKIYKKELESKNQPTKSYEWEDLFVDPKQARKIISFLSEEFLSSTGQWIVEQKNRG